MYDCSSLLFGALLTMSRLIYYTPKGPFLYSIQLGEYHENPKAD